MTRPGWAGDLVEVAVAVAGGVATVTLDRPRAANARNQQMRRDLALTWQRLGTDPDVSVVVLTGAGDRYFCAGMDLKEAAGPETPADRRDRLRGLRDIEQLHALPQPTIAAINGYALGGGLEMALACDIRLIAEHAQVGLTELDHGLVPGGGGTQRLPRLIGPSRAVELILRGTRLTGPEAVTWGIASSCVTADRLGPAAADLGAEIGAKDGRALRYAKELVRRSQELPLSAGLDLELDALLTLMAERTGGPRGG